MPDDIDFALVQSIYFASLLFDNTLWHTVDLYRFICGWLGGSITIESYTYVRMGIRSDSDVVSSSLY